LHAVVDDVDVGRGDRLVVEARLAGTGREGAQAAAQVADDGRGRVTPEQQEGQPHVLAVAEALGGHPAGEEVLHERLVAHS
jgi:hypothetical protein